MVEGGPIDVLTGAYLAELTMTILYNQKLKRGEDFGYVGTFLKQFKDVAKLCEDKKIKKYIPLSKRQDKPDSALWLIRQNNMLKDSQIAKLVGVTKNSVTSIRNKSYWNYNNLNPKDPVALNLFTQKDLIEALEKAERRIKREKKQKEKIKQAREISNIE